MTKKVYQKELNKIVNTLAIKYQPEKIILFGSYARGRPRQNSDVDLAVIKSTQKRFIERLKIVSNLIRSPLGTDILVYTPAEWKESLKGGDYFVKEILKTGKVVYGKSKSK